MSTEIIIRALQGQIESGLLVAGEKLPSERKLAEIHDVSRGVVRKAVQKMVWDGVLESRQGDGTYVVVPDGGEISQHVARAVTSMAKSSRLEEVQEIFELRKVVEPGVAALAAEKRTRNDLRRLKALLFDQQQALAKGVYNSALNSYFHEVLARASKNSLLQNLMDQLNKTLDCSEGFNIAGKTRAEASLRGHMALVEAIEAKDREQARTLMEEHLGEIEHLVAARIEGKKSC
ncbi:MAG: FadR/GntR family transcriptional regulator [Desulfovibrio sp.]